MPFLRDRSNRLRLGGYAVLIAAVAVVLTFGLLSIYHSASASSSVARTVTVEVGTVASSVSASGNVSPSKSDSVNFETGGTLTAVDVAVGDKVKAGEVLARSIRPMLTMHSKRQRTVSRSPRARSQMQRQEGPLPSSSRTRRR